MIRRPTSKCVAIINDNNNTLYDWLYLYTYIYYLSKPQNVHIKRSTFFSCRYIYHTRFFPHRSAPNYRCCIHEVLNYTCCCSTSKHIIQRRERDKAGKGEGERERETGEGVVVFFCKTKKTFKRQTQTLVPQRWSKYLNAVYMYTIKRNHS